MSEIILEPIQANQIDFLTDHRSVSLYYSWLKIGNVGTMADFLEWMRSGAMVEPEFYEFFSEYEDYLLNLKLLPNIEPEIGSPSKYLNEQGEWVGISHDSTTDKNGNPDFQHLNQAQVDAVNSIGKLIVDYTHSGNKEVNVSAYDGATGTFTSIGHGLLASTSLYFVAKNTVTFPLSVMPDGVVLSTQYFPVGITEDTFKLSLTNGGSAVIFPNTTVSVNDFFLESRPYQLIFNFGAEISKFKYIVFSANCLNAMLYNFVLGHNWRSGTISAEYQTLTGVAAQASVTGYIESTYIYQNGMWYLIQKGNTVNASSKTANISTNLDAVKTKVSSTQTMNSLVLYYPTNKQRVLIYKL